MLTTNRLILRSWREDDLEPFAAMSADAEVMRYLRPLDRAACAAWIARQKEHQREHGFCLWAVEIPGVLPFAGAIGLMRVHPPFPFAPAVEVGWRLVRAAWGRGYAEEAARASLAFGFARGMAEIVAYTVPPNTHSWGLMERLGMKRDVGADFDHPLIAPGHPFSREILYRLSSRDWPSAAGAGPAAGS